MKKFKLNSVIASVLSLGIICSGSVFASGDEDGSKAPKPPKSYEISKSHNQVKNSQEDEQFDEAIISFSQEDEETYFRKKFTNCYRESFDEVLSDLEGTNLCKDFPQTIEELADIAFDEESKKNFLDYLDDKVKRLEEEIKNMKKQSAFKKKKKEQCSALEGIIDMVEYADDEDFYDDWFGGEE